VRAGMHRATMHDHWLRQMHLPHVQLDEIRTRLRNRAHTLWLWLALEELTKLAPTLHHPAGTRGAHPDCRAHGRPRSLPTAGPGCLPVFTSDGLNRYFYALTAHFGH
jgi:hypothetical protein